ncbi:hypothetical protein KW790_02295 [Candidatus Parcubacteria bacterium]|nr:hypothetical protein [Candidatus Parcubacteria bacterium]
MANAHAEYNLLRSRAKNIQGKAGTFYERLMAATLGCELSPPGQPDYGDIHSGELGIRVEVKARGDGNAHGLRTSQIERYEWDLPRDLRDTLYALIPYRSRRSIHKGEERPRGFSPRTNKVSMLRGLSKDKELNEYWAKNVDVAYLLDFRIINGLRNTLGTVTGHHAGRPEEQDVVVGRKKLTELFQDDAISRSLRSLGLAPSTWAKGVYPLTVGYTHKYPHHNRDELVDQHLVSQFTLITVVRRDLHVRLAEKILSRALAIV